MKIFNFIIEVNRSIYIELEDGSIADATGMEQAAKEQQTDQTFFLFDNNLDCNNPNKLRIETLAQMEDQYDRK